MEEGARKETRRKGLSRVARWSNHPKTLSWNCLWALFYPRGTANCPPLQNSRRNFAAFRIKSAGLKPLLLSLSRSRSWYLSFSLSHTNRYDRTSSKRRDWTEKNRPPPSNRRPLNSETCIAEKNLTRIRIPRSCLSRVFSKLVVEILDKLSFPRICFHLTRDESWDLLSREGCHVKILISSD